MQTTDVVATIAIGAGATAVMDIWLLVIKSLGVPTGSFALIGRWVGHFGRGRFTHTAIGNARAIPGELAIGWLTHYATGLAYGAMLVGIVGLRWIESPTLLPALAFGIATLTAPLFVMQPAMGSGFAASKTPKPLVHCARSLANHTVFGLGLYLSATAFAWVSR
jgi:hypothetical protein